MFSLNRRIRLSLVAGLLVASLLATASPAAELTEEEKSAFFENEVLPILRDNCFKCHGGKPQVKAEFRITSRDGILEGGELGPAVDLDDIDSSSLIEAINYGGLEMPPNGKLADDQIAKITEWVKLGLPWGENDELGVAEATDGHGPPPVNDETKKFWSFNKPVKPEIPSVENPSGNPIDAFVRAKIEEAGLTPAAKASKAVLLRRTYYDLIGLPPTPEQVAAFEADDSENAYEKVIDQLLDSPQYGERWGRHWLDLVRYAETNSYERDGAKPHVWRYRDYVIRSLNEDKPYDQFVIEQLAGDEMGEETPDQIIATGYYRLGLWQDEPVDRTQELYEDLDDIVTTTAQVFLGLTVNCARCHDHKIDPIPQADYYRFMAFFHGVQRYNARDGESIRQIGTADQKAAQKKEVAAHKKKTDRNQREIKAIEALVKDDFEDVEHEEFKHDKHRIPLLEKRVPDVLSQELFNAYKALKETEKRFKRFQPTALDKALCVNEMGSTPRETFILIRGSAHAKGDKVEPGFPSVLSPPEPSITPPAAEAKTSNRRIALANWIVNKNNPLTARVMVNRIWQFHFGRGIVRSTSDFGFQGMKPTHPKLLDWLAVEFMDGDWKMKRLHKLIMMSDTYQMASKADATALEKDPQNDLFWRFNMRRLEAEEIRDSILAVNGTLNDKMFGPSIYPKIPKEVLAGQSRPGAGWGNSSDEERARRSIYIHTKRSLIVPFIAAFDGADPDASCPERFNTTQPTQALGTLNGEFLNEQAREFSSYLKQKAGESIDAKIETALTRVFQRVPSKEEVDKGVKFLQSLEKKHQVDTDKALDLFCLMALNLNEFIYLD